MSPSRDLPRVLALPYAAVALAVFAALSVGVLVLILPVPGQALRRRMVHHAARLALRAMGMRLALLHAERLPMPCVVVANHSSYLDGVVLCAALPPVFGFVIKREMSKVPLANLLLRRIGAHYVDRNRGQKGGRDTRKLLRKANDGGALVFFPEGTFQHRPGLLPFRSGAFVVAAHAGLPIVPVAIRGTRQALPPRTLLLQPTRIEVELAPPLPAPASTGQADVTAALQAAREAILKRIPDPDLDAGK